MENMYYIVFDVHKKTISYCVKDVSSRVYAEGSVPATRFDLDRWMKTLPGPWTAAKRSHICVNSCIKHRIFRQIIDMFRDTA